MALGEGRTYGVYRANVRFRSGDYILRSVDSYTASTTQTQAGGTPLNHEVNLVASANAADAVTLPASSPGMAVTVILTSATNTCKVFPNAGGTGTETINALSANAAITMAATTRATFFCGVAGQWWTLPLLPS